MAAQRNQPSINVMEKIGMDRVGEISHPLVEDGHSLKPHIVYKMTI
ncbi:hypothetical protein ACFPFV_03640 [Salinicoccus siamensis]